MAPRTNSQRRRRKAKTITPLSRRLRLFFIVLISLPVLILVTGVIGYFYAISWLQGNGFREFLRETLRNTTGAQQVNIPQNLIVADSDLLKLPLIEMKNMGIVSNMSIRELHARPERAALWQRILRFSQFSSDELSITLRFSSPHDSAQKSPPAVSAAKGRTHADSPTRTGNKHGGVFKSIQMHGYTAHYADTDFFTPIGEFHLHGYKLTVASHPHPSQRLWNLKLENGRITTPWSLLPQCGLKSSELLVGGDPNVLRSCRFLLSPGELYASGTYSQRSGLWEAQLELQNADVSKFLSNDWKRCISGSLNGDFSLSGQGKTDEWEASGKLWAKDATISDLPLLSKFQLPGMSPYKKIVLQKASCDLKFPYSDPQHNINRALLWDNIDIHAKGDILRMTGRVITGTDGSLSGSLRLGIPLNMLSLLGVPDSPLTDHLFSKESGAPNFVWITINLSGTISDPHEDLSARLSTLFSQKSVEVPAQVVNALRGLISPPAPPQQSRGDATEKDEGQDESKNPAPQPQKTPTHRAKDIINSGLNILL